MASSQMSILDQELVEFIKTAMCNANFSHQVNNIKQYLWNKEKLLLTEFDGTVGSVVHSDYFWDMVMKKFINYGFWLCLLRKYKFTIEITENIIQPLMPNEYENSSSMIFNLWNYMTTHWEQLKIPVREWAENEFGICPK